MTLLRASAASAASIGAGWAAYAVISAALSSGFLLFAGACVFALTVVGVAAWCGWRARQRALSPDWLSEGNVRR